MDRLEALCSHHVLPSRNGGFAGLLPHPPDPPTQASSFPPPAGLDPSSFPPAAAPTKLVSCLQPSPEPVALEEGTAPGREEGIASAGSSVIPRDLGLEVEREERKRKLVEDYDSELSGSSSPVDLDEKGEERGEAAPSTLLNERLQLLKRKASIASTKEPTKRRAGDRLAPEPLRFESLEEENNQIIEAPLGGRSTLDEQDDQSTSRRTPTASSELRQRASSYKPSPASPSPELERLPLFYYQHELDLAGGAKPLPPSRAAKLDAANKIKESSTRDTKHKATPRLRQVASARKQKVSAPTTISTRLATSPTWSSSSNEEELTESESSVLATTSARASVLPQAFAASARLHPLPTPPTSPNPDLPSTSPLPALDLDATSPSSPSLTSTTPLPTANRPPRIRKPSLKASEPIPEVPIRRGAGTSRSAKGVGKKKAMVPSQAKARKDSKGKGRETEGGVLAVGVPFPYRHLSTSLESAPKSILPASTTPSHSTSTFAGPSSTSLFNLAQPLRAGVLISNQDPSLSAHPFPPLLTSDQSIQPSFASTSRPSYHPITPYQHHTTLHFPQLPPHLRPPEPTPKAPKPKAPKIFKPRKEFEIDKSSWGEPPPVPLVMLNGKPPIWCLGRQELCEALPYYRAYQGGHYDKDERCLGYLLDGFPSPMDRCEDGGRVIISHGGGCSDPSPDALSYQLISNQSRDNTRVRSLINCFEMQVPVALIVGKNYHFFPRLVDMGVRYAVLGYFLVTAYWAEGEPVEQNAKPGSPPYFVRFKFRFEWLPGQGTPWFSDSIGAELPKEFATDKMSLSSLSHLEDVAVSNAPQHDFMAAERSETPLASKTHCSTCGNTFSSVFEEPISCYHDSCPEFFKVNGTMIHPRDLHFLPSFLRALADPSWPTSIPQPLLPQSLQTLRDSTTPYSREAWRAFHCSDCGRLSSRSEWDRLTCATEGCGAMEMMASPMFRADELVGGAGVGQVAKVDGVVGMSLIGLEGFEGVTYQLGEGARVHHLWPRDRTKADELFKGYQAEEAATLFKRNPLATHRVQGQMLCSQFSFNSGVVYNHVVKVQTIPLDASPTAVQHSCDYLTNISQCVVSNPTEATFNEILSVAYMEGGKMNFHDDGETGLGPIVSTLSLGAGATMSFRRKTKKVKSEGKRVSKVVCRLFLQHGDVTIMEGEEVQRVFEHMVEPSGLRFAATARYIGAENAVIVRDPFAHFPPLESLPGFISPPLPLPIQ